MPRSTIEPHVADQPRPMEPRFQRLIEAAAEERRRRVCTCGCRAAPATTPQVMSRTKCAAGMMFIPSLGGVSHHWSEDTREEDIVLGAQVFADAAFRILKAG